MGNCNSSANIDDCENFELDVIDGNIDTLSSF